MKRTTVGLLLACAVGGALAGFGTDQFLTMTGRSTISPGYSLGIVLVLVGAAVLVLAIPVRRSIKDPKAPRVNPFRAFRTAVLAKASSILGALSGGFGAGLLLFLLSRPVPTQVGSIAPVITTIAAGIVLVILALVAEKFCTLPKDDDDDPTADPAAAHS